MLLNVSKRKMLKKRALGRFLMLFILEHQKVGTELRDRLSNLPAARPLTLKKHECVLSFKNLLQREVEFSHSMAILPVINKFSLITEDFACISGRERVFPVTEFMSTIIKGLFPKVILKKSLENFWLRSASLLSKSSYLHQRREL